MRGNEEKENKKEEREKKMRERTGMGRRDRLIERKKKGFFPQIKRNHLR